jgi:flagellar basal body P-ring protein FlgI
MAGCTSWNLLPGHKKKDKEPDVPEVEAKVVGDLAVPFGLFPVKVEAVGLVTGLHGTGSDPEPSAERSMLLEEMERRGVKNPNVLLASHDVSLVLVRGILRPGVQKGDRFDVEVRIPGRSETKSLRGGYLLETRLTDMGVFNDRVLDGKLRGFAQGPVLVDPSASSKEKDDRVLLGRGRVLGGGIAHESRSLGLFLKNAEEVGDMTPKEIREAAIKSAQVANAINRRFHTFKKGIQVGVATAKTGTYVDLLIYPRYKDNIDRYMAVLRAIMLKETPSETEARIHDLEKDLMNPSTAGRAAVQLEAIGTTAAETLLKGIKSSDREVRFFSAEALAYMDRREAAESLGEAARQEPAFRVYALSALAVMEDFAAYEQLRDMLGVVSAETRYGAFRALWTMNPNDPLIKGELLGGQFSYHIVETQAPPMIHVTKNRRAEVVLFGREQRFLTPLAVNAGHRIMVTSINNAEIAVSKFATNETDQKRIVSTRVDDVIRAIVELGGTYPDVVQALQEARTANALEGRFEVEALPESGRTYERLGQADADTADKDKANKTGKDKEKGEKVKEASCNVSANEK